jgi:hypothetical protein
MSFEIAVDVRWNLNWQEKPAQRLSNHIRSHMKWRGTELGPCDLVTEKPATNDNSYGRIYLLIYLFGLHLKPCYIFISTSLWTELRRSFTCICQQCNWTVVFAFCTALQSDLALFDLRSRILLRAQVSRKLGVMYFWTSAVVASTDSSGGIHYIKKNEGLLPRSLSPTCSDASETSLLLRIVGSYSSCYSNTLRCAPICAH